MRSCRRLPPVAPSTLPAALALLALLVPLVLLAPPVASDDEASPAITAAELHGHVRTLADDAWRGRGSGTEGEQAATAYIAAHFERLGLAPAGEKGTFFQEVRMRAGMKVKPGSALALLADGAPELKLDSDFRPFSFSAQGWAKGDAVFAGYGITAPGRSYDDYAGLDVAGKVVFVFRHLPHGEGWGGRARMRHATFQAKLANATKRGAVGLVVVNDPHHFPARAAGDGDAGDGDAGDGASDAAPRGRGRRGRRDVVFSGNAGGGSGTIPSLHLTLAGARKLFPALFGATPEELEQAIHAKPQAAPASRAGKARVHVHSDIEHTYLVGRNVCALLRAGAADAKDEVIVLGAHHDHVGTSGVGSLAPPARRREIHNGADDNASGTSGVLEVAEHLASKRASLKRSVLFLTFTGEERGLLGSRHFVEQPTVPLEKVVAMINMDMIGRLEGRRLFVGGVKTAKMFRPILEELVARFAVDVQFGDGGRAPSDNTSFYNKKIPVLFFFSGGHRDYHRPTDDADKIDAEGMVKAARLAAGAVLALATTDERPAFQRADRGGMPVRAVLGIRTADGEGGVAISFLQPRGPASQAGLARGDVILAIGEKKTPHTAALTDVMMRLRPGEKIVVRFRRGDEERTVEVTLGSSAR